jgi:hypothetical protein
VYANESSAVAGTVAVATGDDDDSGVDVGAGSWVGAGLGIPVQAASRQDSSRGMLRYKRKGLDMIVLLSFTMAAIVLQNPLAGKRGACL